MWTRAGLFALGAVLAATTATTAAGAQARTITPIQPGSGFIGGFGQPIRAMGQPYMLGAGPLGGIGNATGPLARGPVFFGPLSGLAGGQPLLGRPLPGSILLAPPFGGGNLLSNQPIFNGGTAQNPIVPTINSPYILSSGGPGFGLNPVVGFGGPVYPGYTYYEPQPGYNGGIPGISGGATVNTAAPGAAAAPGSTAIPRTSDWIDAKLQGANRLSVSWQGDPRAVNRVVFALLDANRKPIKQQVVTRTPVRATLALTSATAYYQVLVEYVNGTTTSVIAPL